MRHTLPLLLAASSLALAACAVGPDYQPPKLQLGQQFHTAPVAATPADETWWHGFGDAELDRVVARAEAQNLDLEQARARIRQSRAGAAAAGAALLPKGEATANADDVQQSLLTPIALIGHNLPGYERDYGLYQLGAAASWEIDLFGGLRRAKQAAEAEAQGSEDQAEAIRISVMAEAADAYLQARALQSRLKVAQDQLQVQHDLVALIQRRARDGVSSDRDLNEAQAALEGVQAAIPALTAALDAEFNRLDVLMGAEAGTYRAELEASSALPTAPAIAAADGPAGLLRRRPDVRAAEQRLQAANARIGQAIAEYYPKVSLATAIGGASVNAKDILGPAAIQSDSGLGLRWRLFDFGRVDAEVAAAKGKNAEALAAYRSVVLKAGEEVEDAFSDLQQDGAQADALARRVDHLTLARRQAERAYEEGVTSLIEVRDLDRDLLAASDALVLARAGQARSAVAAFRALGGGWSAPVSRS